MTPKNKKDKALNRTSRIEIRLSDEELKIITEKAQAHNQNTSTYLRNLGMNYPIKSMVDQQAVLALLKVNGDLGKVGGLFKMWLMRNGEYKDDFSGERTYKDIDALVDELQDLMKSFRERASDLMDKI